MNSATATLLDATSPLVHIRTEVLVSFLLEIHNIAPLGSEIRSRVLGAIDQVACRDAKAHWARGLLLSANGELVFDHSRYLHAVYQGKQDTYAKAAQKAFDELQRSLEMVAFAQNSECAAIEGEAACKVEGKPLVELTTPSHPAALLKTAADTLPTFVRRMASGMDVALGGSVRAIRDIENPIAPSDPNS